MKFPGIIDVNKTSWSKCPFCSGRYAILPMGGDMRAVVHSDPMCTKFDAEDPLVFLRNARVATIGPQPGDDEWPLPVRGGGNN